MISKAAFKYQFEDSKKAIIIYYCILLAVMILLSAGFSLISIRGNAQFNGIELSTMIFMFIAGLNSFKEPFLMLSQNGVSRQSMFVSHIFVMLCIAFIMAVIDQLLLLGLNLLSANNPNFTSRSLYELVFHNISKSAFLLQLNILWYNFLMYISVFAFGYMLTVLFYRLNKAGKIAVGVGVPVSLLIVLPALDSMLFDSSISRALSSLTSFIYSTVPLWAMVSYASSFILFNFIAWLLMRKAAIRV